MPLESATYISDLVSTNPIHTDGLNAADSHMRLIKAVLKTTFPNVNAAVTGTPVGLSAAAAAFSGGAAAIPAGGTVSAEVDLLGATTSGRVQFINSGTVGGNGGLSIAMTNTADASSVVGATLNYGGTLAATTALNAPSVQQGGNALLPTGIVCMWSGSIASIPAGWHLCDGTNGTPNLEDCFIVAAGNSYAVAQTGGITTQTATTASAGSHNHTGATGSAGAHNHTGASGTYALAVGDLPAHSHTISDPGHGHTYNEPQFTSINNTGGSGAWVGTVGATTGTATTGISINNTGSGTAHSHSISTDGAHTNPISTDGAHTHSVSFDNRPQFYALALIMKL